MQCVNKNWEEERAVWQEAKAKEEEAKANEALKDPWAFTYDGTWEALQLEKEKDRAEEKALEPEALAKEEKDLEPEFRH